MISLYEHQKISIEQLRNGSILCGGVGSGKSRTGLTYYMIKECEAKLKINNIGGYSPMKKPKDLYIITTARKRDTLEWEQECLPFQLPVSNVPSQHPVKVTIDSWNNIGKYIHVKNAFFLFDEQRVVGSGSWVRSFYKICKTNRWILLSATPGDTWMDYIPVFVANGYYKNKTEFIRRHVVYNTFTKYPKVDRYVEVARLIRLRDQIVVKMRYQKKTIAHEKTVITDYNKELLDTVMVKRWNPYENEPVRDVSALCYLMRKVVNSDPTRLAAVIELLIDNPKMIVFYNFNYELHLLLAMAADIGIPVAQWNGHKHEHIPDAERWLYLVQYTAGAEGWNCIDTNATTFYSQNYSYKVMTQAAGRIDRLNTPYTDLYYYHLRSNSTIDLAINKSLKGKRDFNESRFLNV